jgi:GDP-4-dehydro-6-deoxy-D-mannose reductase
LNKSVLVSITDYSNLLGMSKKILVTGVNGFVGQHLVKELVDNSIEVVGVGGSIGSVDSIPGVSAYQVIDLSKKEDAAKIDFSGIDGVIHLAGLAAVGPSFDNPMQYINVNIGIETNLFEAALAQNTKPKFVIVSSGSLYDPRVALPLSEKSSVIPSSPYAVSKIGQEQMAHYYGLRGFECIVVRPFNHIGPGQNPGFLVPDVAQQIIEVEKGSADSVLVGNLDAKRDYTDVRDIVRAYRLVLERGVAGKTYNICSGASVSGHDIVNGLLKAAGGTIKIEQDPDRMRPSDAPDIYGDHGTITKDTGWEPEISLDKTLSDVIADWRNR